MPGVQKVNIHSAFPLSIRIIWFMFHLFCFFFSTHCTFVNLIYVYYISFSFIVNTFSQFYYKFSFYCCFDYLYYMILALFLDYFYAFWHIIPFQGIIYFIFLTILYSVNWIKYLYIDFSLLLIYYSFVKQFTILNFF